MLLRISFLLIILCCINSCYQGAIIDFNYKNPNPKTGYFTTFGTINANEVIINQSVDLAKYKRLLVLDMKPMIQLNPLNQLSLTRQIIHHQNEFWQKSLQAQGFFDNVVPINELFNFLSNRGYRNLPVFLNNISYRNFSNSLLNLTSLQETQKIYGNFLVIELSTEGDIATLRIIDPATKITYFKIRRTQLVVTGYSQQLYYPMLNAFKDWLKKNA